jgi:hypothetical protein
MRSLMLPLAYLPALATGLLVCQHAENVPVWDDFDRVPLLERFADGELGVRDLYAAHIDHRIVMTRLVILANAKLSGGNLVWENWVTFAIVLGTAVVLGALLRRSLPDAPATCFAAVLGMNALVFSPLQWENFLWAIQTAFVLPTACLVAALLALELRLSLWVRFGLALAAAVVGTHSFSHGLLIWGAVPAWMLLRGSAPNGAAAGNSRKVFVMVWAVAAAAILLPYFLADYRVATSHAYGVVAGERTPFVAYAAEAASHPRLAAHFYLSMVGSPLARLGPWPPRDVALAWGLVVHGLLAVALTRVVLARDRALWERSLPWIVLAGTTLIACGLAALGRAVPTNALYALAPRYVSVSQYALVALVALGALLACRSPRARVVVVAIAGLLALPVAAGWRAGVDGMGGWQTARLQARTSLLFIRDFAPRYVKRLDRDYAMVRGPAEALDRYGYLDPPLARDRRPDAFEFAQPGADGVSGDIEAARVGPGRLAARGHAALGWRPGREAHGVLLTVGDEGARRVVGIGEGRARPPGRLYRHDHLHGEIELDPAKPTGVWRAKVDVAQLPEAPVVQIEAFVVDADHMRLHPLPQRLRVTRSAGELRVEVESIEEPGR